MEQAKYDIFVSYSRKDAKKVHEYVTFFEALGYTVWLDRSGIESGDAFRQVIVEAIEKSKLFIFFSSKSSNNSKWTSSEIAIAIEENKKIIPIKLDLSKYSPAVRMDLVGVDYVYDKHPDSLQKIEKSLQAVLGVRTHESLGHPVDNISSQKFKYKLFISIMLILLFFPLVLFYIMRDEDEKSDTYIDKGMQGICERVLKKGMLNKENNYKIINADLILMECETGKIRARVSFRKDSTGTVVPLTNRSSIHETAMSKIVNILACIETGIVNKNTIIDTGNGMLIVSGRLMKDHSCYRGGFGQITLSQVLENNSNIGTWIAVDSCFHTKGELMAALVKMGYGLPDDSIKGFDYLYPQRNNIISLEKNNTSTSFPWFSIGYNHQMTDIQLIAFFNAIANKGKMIRPRLYKDEYKVIKSCIVKKESLKEIQDIMKNVVVYGTGKKAKSDIITISGFNSTTQLYRYNDNQHYLRQFYAYFPADSPRYSVLLSLEYKGLYDNTISDYINEIAELIYFKEIH